MQGEARLAFRKAHMTTEAQRLVASGIPLTLTDGRTVTLRYDMRALVEIEKAFGSLDKMQDALGEGAPVLTSTVKVLAAGLTREGFTADSLVDLLDVSKLAEYAEKMQEALAEAFPPQPAEAAVVPISNGAASTGSAPAASAELKTSSGA